MPAESVASVSCSADTTGMNEAATDATAPTSDVPTSDVPTSDVPTPDVPTPDVPWRVRRGEGAFKFSRTIRREPSIMMPLLGSSRVIAAIVLLLPNNPPTKAPMEAPALPVKKIAPFWLVEALRAPNELPST